jgi:nucleoside-triphosphatase
LNILLTGDPGSGKSTLVQELIREMRGCRLAGIITPEIREGGKRSGFQIVDLVSGEEETLASVRFQEGPRVGRYGVNVGGVDRIVDLFLTSLPHADCVFLDEIGKMEMFSQKFRHLSVSIFGSGKIVIAVVHRSLVDRFEDKGELIWVDRPEFAAIKAHILDRVCPLL